MALNFPNSPSDGDIYAVNGITYRYNSTVGAWLILSNVVTGNLSVSGTISGNSGIIAGSMNVEPTVQAVFSQANTIYLHANAAFEQANTARDHANAAFDQANTARTHANAAHLTANVSFDQANTARTHANAAHLTANAAFDQANTARNHANAAHLTANAAFNQANAAPGIANSYAVIVGAASNSYAQSVGSAANSVSSAAFDQANTARNHANVAFATANSKFSSSGGTITGDVNIVGNLTMSGNTAFINVATYRVDDPLIYLAGNNYTSDLVDIGFIANYVNATGQNVHTGLYREHENKMYYLFQGYDQEPINNHIGAMSNNMTLAVLNADLATSNLLLAGTNTVIWIRSAYNQANTARDQANISFSQANTASNIAIAAFNKANTGGGGITYIKKTSNYTANAGDGIIADTSTGSFNVTLPATPNVGTQIVIVDGNNWAANTLVVLRNGSTIEDVAEDLTLDVAGTSVTFIYDGNTWETYFQLGISSLGTQNIVFNMANAAFLQANNAYAAANAAFDAANTDAPLNVVSDTVNATRYIMFANGTSGSVSTLNVATGLTFNPSSNALDVNGTITSEYVRIDGLGDASLSSTTHAFQVGPTSGQNIIIDQNEIMGRNNGAISTLYLQNDGGDLYVGGRFVANNTVTNATQLDGVVAANYARTDVADVFNSTIQTTALGVGTAASATTGEIRATNNITAYYSDKRLKTDIKIIDNALAKVNSISGVMFKSNEEAAKYGYTDTKTQVGVIAQEIEAVLPEVVVPAPFDIDKNEDGVEYSKSGQNYKTVQYEKLVPLLIESIKELSSKVTDLEKQIKDLKDR